MIINGNPVYVQIKMPDGTIVKSEVSDFMTWDAGTVEITLKNGRTYITHMSNVVISSKTVIEKDISQNLQAI